MLLFHLGEGRERLEVHRGDQWWLPLHVSGINLVYNRTAFEQAGAPLPPMSYQRVWTFDEFQEVCRRLTRRAGDEMAPLWVGRKTARDMAAAAKQALDPPLQEARRMDDRTAK